MIRSGNQVRTSLSIQEVSMKSMKKLGIRQDFVQALLEW